MHHLLKLAFHLRAVACTCALCWAASAHAQLSYHFSVNTSPLISSSAGPFYLDFQLNDGSGLGDGNNQVTLSHFTFGGGSAFGATAGMGSFSGSLLTTVTLTDGSAFNEFYQAFTPGSLLQFDLTLTTRVDSGFPPDGFAFAILDNTLSNLPTLSGGSDAFATIDIAKSPVLHTYAGNGAIAPNAGGPGIALAAPVATPVPEPSTYGVLAALALLSAVILRRRSQDNAS